MVTVRFLVATLRLRAFSLFVNAGQLESARQLCPPTPLGRLSAARRYRSIVNRLQSASVWCRVVFPARTVVRHGRAWSDRGSERHICEPRDGPPPAVLRPAGDEKHVEPSGKGPRSRTEMSDRSMSRPRLYKELNTCELPQRHVSDPFEHHYGVRDFKPHACRGWEREIPMHPHCQTIAM